MPDEMNDLNLSEKIGLYRLLDANFNRSFEAFRVIEDITRFSFDNILITERIKELRHGLKAVAVVVGRQMVAYRDVLSDVGAHFTDPDEEKRADQADLVFANFGRLKESFRVLEEATKVSVPEVSGTLKRIRYQIYELEKRIAQLIRPKGRLNECFFYVITGNDISGGNPVGAAREAIAGGADIIQLREKNLGSGEFLKLARGLREVTAAEGALFIVNDSVEIAVLSHADGVHLGQEDLPVSQARKLVGPDRIIGVSTHSAEEAERAVAEGADYIAVGAIFQTDTKDDAVVGGLDLALAVGRKVKGVPLFAVGGINAANLPQVLDAGIRRAAVSSAVVGARNVRSAAEELKKQLSAGGGKTPG